MTFFRNHVIIRSGRYNSFSFIFDFKVKEYRIHHGVIEVIL